MQQEIPLLMNKIIYIRVLTGPQSLNETYLLLKVAFGESQKKDTYAILMSLSVYRKYIGKFNTNIFPNFDRIFMPISCN